jgi:ankyrin repeat protein
MTPLMLMCLADKYEDCESVLARGANPDIQNEQGDTALHLATKRGCKELIELLLRHNADADIETQVFQQHPCLILTFAQHIHENTVFSFFSPLISVLTTTSSSHINFKDNQTPLDIAKSLDKAECLEVLEAHFAASLK